MYLREIVDKTPGMDGASDLRRVFAYNRRVSPQLLAFTQAVMRESGPLTPGECELLAALTSKENHCLF
jgi:hypothetical protein